MKAIIKKNTYNKQTPVCAWIQGYDNNGEYYEVFIEDVKPKDIPKEVIESFETNHDICLFIAPGDMVGVFAKHAMDIVYYTKYFYGTAELKAMLGEYTDNEMVECTVTHLTKGVDPKESRYLR